MLWGKVGMFSIPTNSLAEPHNLFTVSFLLFSDKLLKELPIRAQGMA